MPSKGGRAFLSCPDKKRLWHAAFFQIARGPLRTIGDQGGGEDEPLLRLFAIDGIKLSAHIRDRWPPIEIVITSDKPCPDDTELPQWAVFFLAPVRQDRVIETIQRMAA